MNDSKWSTGAIITILSLIIALLGSLSTFYSAKAANEQAQIAVSQYQDSKPKLVVDAFEVEIFPVVKQEDNLNPPYRAGIYATLINESSLPITITRFRVENDNGDLIAFSAPHFTYNEKYVVKRQWVDSRSYTDYLINLEGERLLKPLITLPPYDAKTGHIFLLVQKIEALPIQPSTKIHLVADTSRGPFGCDIRFKIENGLKD